MRPSSAFARPSTVVHGVSDAAIDRTGFRQCDYIGQRTLLPCVELRSRNDINARGHCEKHSAMMRVLKKQGEEEEARMIIDVEKIPQEEMDDGTAVRTKTGVLAVAPFTRPVSALRPDDPDLFNKHDPHQEGAMQLSWTGLEPLTQKEANNRQIALLKLEYISINKMRERNMDKASRAYREDLQRGLPRDLSHERILLNGERGEDGVPRGSMLSANERALLESVCEQKQYEREVEAERTRAVTFTECIAPMPYRAPFHTEEGVLLPPPEAPADIPKCREPTLTRNSPYCLKHAVLADNPSALLSRCPGCDEAIVDFGNGTYDCRDCRTAHLDKSKTSHGSMIHRPTSPNTNRRNRLTGLACAVYTKKSTVIRKEFVVYDEHVREAERKATASEHPYAMQGGARSMGRGQQQSSNRNSYYGSNADRRGSGMPSSIDGTNRSRTTTEPGGVRNKAYDILAGASHMGSNQTTGGFLKAQQQQAKRAGSTFERKTTVAEVVAALDHSTCARTRPLTRGTIDESFIKFGRVPRPHPETLEYLKMPLTALETVAPGATPSNIPAPPPLPGPPPRQNSMHKYSMALPPTAPPMTGGIPIPPGGRTVHYMGPSAPTAPPSTTSSMGPPRMAPRSGAALQRGALPGPPPQPQPPPQPASLAARRIMVSQDKTGPQSWAPPERAPQPPGSTASYTGNREQARGRGRPAAPKAPVDPRTGAPGQIPRFVPAVSRPQPPHRMAAFTASSSIHRAIPLGSADKARDFARSLDLLPTQKTEGAAAVEKEPVKTEVKEETADGPPTLTAEGGEKPKKEEPPTPPSAVSSIHRERSISLVRPQLPVLRATAAVGIDIPTAAPSATPSPIVPSPRSMMTPTMGKGFGAIPVKQKTQSAVEETMRRSSTQSQERELVERKRSMEAEKESRQAKRKMQSMSLPPRRAEMTETAEVKAEEPGNRRSSRASRSRDLTETPDKEPSEKRPKREAASKGEEKRRDSTEKANTPRTRATPPASSAKKDRRSTPISSRTRGTPSRMLGRSAEESEDEES